MDAHAVLHQVMTTTSTFDGRIIRGGLAKRPQITLLALFWNSIVELIFTLKCNGIYCPGERRLKSLVDSLTCVVLPHHGWFSRWQSFLKLEKQAAFIKMSTGGYLTGINKIPFSRKLSTRQLHSVWKLPNTSHFAVCSTVCRNDETFCTIFKHLKVQSHKVLRPLSIFKEERARNVREFSQVEGSRPAVKPAGKKFNFIQNSNTRLLLLACQKPILPSHNFRFSHVFVYLAKIKAISLLQITNETIFSVLAYKVYQ